MIRFESVSMRYAGGPDVLKSVSFQLDDGEFAFLTGPSGAGKTTLLRLVLMTEQPVSGRVVLFGHDPASAAPGLKPGLRRKIGAVFQDFRLIEHLTAFENVALPLRIQGERPADYRADVEEILEWVGLGARMHATPASLSGGEQQRVAIARAVITKPALIIADEPTGSIDPEMGRRLLRLFVELNRLGTSVLIATHDRALIEQSGARELRLSDGWLEAGPVRR